MSLNLITNHLLKFVIITVKQDTGKTIYQFPHKFNARISSYSFAG